MTVQIRRVTHSGPNLATVQYLDRVCFQWDTPFNIYDETALWIGRDKGIPVCFASLQPLDHGMAFLSRAGVLSQYSGQGLHRRLINLRLRHAKRAGFSSVVTYVNRLNVRSLNNLVRQGFKAYYPEAEWGSSDSVYLWYGFPKKEEPKLEIV